MFICPKKILMALLFMLLAAPVAFQAVRAVLGGWIATAEGLPKVGGLAVHAVVFMVLSTLIWRYVPIGSSRFAEEFRYNWEAVNRRRAAARASRYENEPEEYGHANSRSRAAGAAMRARFGRYENEPEEFRKCTRRNKRTGETWEVDCYAEEPEEFNQPDPSKMHAGVYH
jgi:hypothetical protein